MGISASVGTQIPTNVVEVGTEISQPSLDAISSAPSATSVNRFVVLNDLVGKANLAGATFTGKINLAPPTAGGSSLNIGIGVIPTVGVAGDIYIGTNLNFKDSSGTLKTVANTNTGNTFSNNQIISCTSTVAGLRITQAGIGNAIEVEDSATPDSTKFVVDQFGKVGIGVAPDATACLSVDVTGIKFSNGSVQTIASAVGPTGPTGPTGPAGPAGANATAWVYMGAYDNGYTYSIGDFVTSDGSSYVLYNYIGGAGYHPINNPSYWQVVASVGAQGPNGNDGSQGQQGNDGGTYPDASYDSVPYIRINQSWEPLSSHITLGDAPQDNNYYVRKDGNWIQCYTTNQYGYNMLYIP
jgi:hypothetical protein